MESGRHRFEHFLLEKRCFPTVGAPGVASELDGLVSPADLNQVVAIIDSVELTVMTLVPDTLTVCVEPDVHDPTSVAASWT